MATNAADTRVLIKTTAGDIVIRLYDDTPAHRDNFIRLVNDGFYNGVLFHRVINDFMIQTGDPDSKTATPGQMLGSGDPGYTIEAEIICPRHFNRRGALAAARTGDEVNPERRSSGSQFYIVTGTTFTDGQLDQMEHRMTQQAAQEAFSRLSAQHRDEIMDLRRARNQAALAELRDTLAQQAMAEAEAHPFKFTDEQREVYRTLGGAPHLDGAYTVFGEVVEGMDIVGKIEETPTDKADRPLDDIRVISMEILK